MIKSLVVACVLTILTLGLWAETLPDAPGVQPAPPASAQSTEEPVPTPVMRGRTEGPVSDREFMVAGALLFSSSIANAELIARCRDTSCQAVPDSLRSRGALYGVGIPADIVISYFSYRMKRSRHVWWFVPMAVVTAGNIIYASHAAQYGK